MANVTCQWALNLALSHNYCFSDYPQSQKKTCGFCGLLKREKPLTGLTRSIYTNFERYQGIVELYL